MALIILLKLINGIIIAQVALKVNLSMRRKGSHSWTDHVSMRFLKKILNICKVYKFQVLYILKSLRKDKKNITNNLPQIEKNETIKIIYWGKTFSPVIVAIKNFAYPP